MDSDEEITPLKRRRKVKTTHVQESKAICNENQPIQLPPLQKSTIPKNAGPEYSQVKSKSPRKCKSSSTDEILSFKGLFSSTNNKSDMIYFKPRSVEDGDKEKLIHCPICNINLVFLHARSAQGHINDCLDKKPNFEKGYCSGYSNCSLSNAQHFREFKHNESVNQKNEDEANGTEKQISPTMLKNNTEGSPKKQTSINDFFGGKKPARKKPAAVAKRYKIENKQSMKKERKPKNARKECPFYKKIPGTGFTVDAFRYGDIPGCTCYFLTHFHSDHYGGLTKSFNKKLYCSKITASLVQCQIKVSPEFIHILPMHQRTCIEGVKITPLDANHCPGAVMFLMELPSGKRILHVGDFRADLSMLSSPVINHKQIDTLFLDTTYCDPKYTFPPQNDVINYVVSVSRNYLRENPKTLIVCGSYSVGKEKVFRAIATDQDLKIAVRKPKLNLLKCIDDDELEKRLVLDYDQAGLHVLPMNYLSIKALQEHLLNQKKNKWERILAFKPTGWTFSDRLTSLKEIVPIRRPDVTIYGVPYSEHSSFEELKSFVQALKPKQIIPTVNIGRKESRDQMNVYFMEWLK